MQDNTEEKSKEISMKTCKENSHLLVSCYDNGLYRWSIEENKTIHKYGNFSTDFGIEIHPNKKTFFLSQNKQLHQYDIKSHKCIKKANGIVRKEMKLTYDGKYLIILKSQSILEIFSIRTLKKLRTIKTFVTILSFCCSYDSKYIFTSHMKGWVTILDIKNGKVLITFRASEDVCKIRLFEDNQNAILCDSNNVIKQINWKKNASTRDDFQLSNEYKTIPDLPYEIERLFITSNGERLLIACDKLFKVQEFSSGLVIKEINFSSRILQIGQIANGTKAVIVKKEGQGLYIFDLNLLEITEKKENFNFGSSITNIKVI